MTGEPGAATGQVAPPEGSDFHYASLYLEPSHRRTVQILEAWRRELAVIPQTCSDRGVAHIKLAWWREEIARSREGAPRHPLARAIAPLLTASPTLAPVLERFVDRVDAGLLEPILPTRAAVLAEIAALHGEFFQIYLDMDDNAPKTRTAELVELACMSELAYELRGLRQHRRGGPLYLDQVTLARHGLDGDAVRHATDSATLRAALSAQMSDLSALLAARLDALPRGLRRRHCLITTQARLAAGALRLTLADGCRVLERRVELLPVHKLWIAWRTRYLG